MHHDRIQILLAICQHLLSCSGTDHPFWRRGLIAVNCDNCWLRRKSICCQVKVENLGKTSNEGGDGCEVVEDQAHLAESIQRVSHSTVRPSLNVAQEIDGESARDFAAKLSRKYMWSVRDLEENQCDTTSCQGRTTPPPPPTLLDVIIP